MGISGAQNQITQTVLSWENTEVHPHQYGGVEYRLGKRQLGHIHGDHLVDIPFPTRLRYEIVASGQARPHHIQPESGWVSCFLRRPEDVDTALQLLRRSYDLAQQQRGSRQPHTPRPAELPRDDPARPASTSLPD
jgi:hypothetical protein